MKLQYSVGPAHFGGLNWVECKDRADYFIDTAATFNKVSRDTIVAKLEGGQRVRFDSEWYAELRDADRVKPRAPVPELPPKRKCKVCGEWQPASRFTTLPTSACTCDDCA